MKALGLLGVLIVLVAIGALCYYVWASWQARKQHEALAKAPWEACEGEIDGHWVVQARRPGHDPIVLARTPIEEGFLSLAIDEAHAQAQENFLALKPRAKWDLS